MLLGDFVTANDGTGLVHTAIAFGEDDFRLGEQYGLNVVNPVRLDGTYDERIGPYAGRWVKDADPDLIEDLRARGRLLRAEELRALLSALLALPHAADLLRQAVLVHRHEPDQGPPAGGQRDRQLAPRPRQARPLRQLARGQRRLGAVARALLGHAAAGVALRATSTSRRSARSPSCTTLSGVELDRPASAVRRRGHVPVPDCGETMQPRPRGDRRLVRLGLDAVRPVPRAARRHPALRGALPGRLHLRGARPDARLVLLADRRLDAAVRPLAVPQRRLPRADPRRGRPQDVQVAGQHGRSRGR